ncbi:MAG: UbiA prenyltransferase family protein [Thermodesulfobacteriota bacterium]|nr:UbiA prenyltransferase family protein [Thermodesulfobacteriota bacterium]
MNKITSYIKLARPHQYVKNGFIFFPVFFGHKLGDPDAVWQTFLAFFCFSLGASSVYIFNDINDIGEDRNHPVKKHRPLVSGVIKRTESIILLLLLLATTLFISITFLPAAFLYILGAYFFINFFYSLGLKNIPIVDVTIIAIGFVLRVFAGGVAAELIPSHWIVLMTFLIAIFLALAKRRDELVLAQYGRNNNGRRCLSGYNLEFVSAGMNIMAGVTIVSYILYTVSPEVVAVHGTDKIYFTSFWVIIGILRYLQVTLVQGKSGSPTLALINDPFLVAVLALWILNFIFVLYF